MNQDKKFQKLFVKLEFVGKLLPTLPHYNKRYRKVEAFNSRIPASRNWINIGEYSDESREVRSPKLWPNRQKSFSISR